MGCDDRDQEDQLAKASSEGLQITSDGLQPTGDGLQSSSFLLLVASLLPVVRPGAPSSILAPSSDARSP